METMLIQVKVKTANILKDMRITNRESYDEVINRLIEGDLPTGTPIKFKKKEG